MKGKIKTQEKVKGMELDEKIILGVSILLIVGLLIKTLLMLEIIKL